MKYTITTENTVVGPFTSVTTTEVGYLCDGVLFPFNVVDPCTIGEVPDDWVNPVEEAAKKEREKEAFNESQRKRRESAYKAESDPIYFLSQRGEATQQEWLDKIAEIKARFPYQE